MAGLTRVLGWCAYTPCELLGSGIPCAQAHGIEANGAVVLLPLLLVHWGINLLATEAVKT